MTRPEQRGPRAGRRTILAAALLTLVAFPGQTAAADPTRSAPPAERQPGAEAVPDQNRGALALPAGVTPVAGSVTFHGRGYGHGVGLSQYGARGRALAGQDAAAIIAHYYQGTAIGTISRSITIRVLLLSRWAATKAAPFVIVGRGGSWKIDGIATTFPADATLTYTPSTATTATGLKVAWRLKVRSAGGTLLYDAAVSNGFRVRPASSSTRLEVRAKPSGKNRYRGVLRVLPRTDAAAVSLVNELALDHYLRGVVPAEMPASWPVEALRAQSIVARSYAARALKPKTVHWDVYDDTRSQVYQGSLAERTATNDAVVATAGRIVTYGTAIANTVFHSTAGGHTEHNENAFVSSTGRMVAGPLPYLRGVSDSNPAGGRYDDGAPYATWTSSTWTASQLSTWLASDARTNTGALQGLDLRNRGVSGRLISVTIHGSAGTKTVSGTVFRSVINADRPSGDRPIRSDLFDVVPVP